MKKRLVLNRDVLVDLTTDQLLGVAGAAGVNPTPKCTTLNVECPSDPVTGCTIIYETQHATCAACGVTMPTDICV